MNHSIATGLLSGFVIILVSSLFLGEALDAFTLAFGTVVFGVLVTVTDWAVLRITGTIIKPKTTEAESQP